MANFVVTITGADDDIDPAVLAAMSEEYPFVEWGILFSNSSPGKKRYPSKQWRSELYATLLSCKHTLNLSAHLCGSMVQDFFRVDNTWVNELDMFYRRIQFNNYTALNQETVRRFANQSKTPCILPMNAKVKLFDDVTDSSSRSRISYLFDSSGGRGVERVPNDWPKPIEGSHVSGYAGGITAENISAHLRFLIERHGIDQPFWVDLETGARDENNVFNINKVVKILDIAENFQSLKNLKQVDGPKIILSSK